MKKTIKNANRNDSFLSDNPARLEFLHHDDSTRQSPQIPIAIALANCLRNTGFSDEIVPGPFACDARHLVNQGNIPSVIFGPGSIAQAHKPDEHIQIHEYLECIQHLIFFIASWCNETRDLSFQKVAEARLPT